MLCSGLDVASPVLSQHSKSPIEILAVFVHCFACARFTVVREIILVEFGATSPSLLSLFRLFRKPKNLNKWVQTLELKALTGYAPHAKVATLVRREALILKSST